MPGYSSFNIPNNFGYQPSYPAGSGVSNSPASSQNTNFTDGRSGYSWFGGDNTVGLFNPVVQGVGGLFGIYNSLRNYDLAQDSLDFQRDAFREQMDASRRDYRNQLETQYRRRSAGQGSIDPDALRAYIDERSI